MDRTERFYLIERLLQQRKLVTRAQFMDALGVSLATFKRDLEYMRDRLHAPIAWNAEKQGYEFAPAPGDAPTFELPGLWFNQSELAALLTMHQLLGELEPGILAPHVAPLRARLEALLGEGPAPAGEVQTRVRIVRQAARRSPRETFGTVAGALLERKRLHFAYDARSTGEHSERTVSPQRLVLYRDNWYLDAWCHMRDGLRKFALDAMQAPQRSDEAAIDISSDVLERKLASGYGIFSGEEVTWATLRFTPSRARWVAHEQWHPQQRGRLEPDGSYVLEVPFADPRELVMDVLKYGADVEVLGPSTLRTLVVDEVGKLAQAYRAT